MELFPLKSGSRGNAALLMGDNTKILIDCGISGKALLTELEKYDITPQQLDGIVVTHEHSDHVSGIGVVMRRYKLPVWASCGTWNAMYDQLGKIDDELIHRFDITEQFEIGDIGVCPFAIPHDAAEPCGYSFVGDDKMSVATDIGELTAEMFAALKGSKTVLLEANHDVNMLEMGSYPYSLKRRIRGNRGHLSNDEAGKAAEYLVKLGTENIILGHLSEDNNYPALAYKTVEYALSTAQISVGSDVQLSLA